MPNELATIGPFDCPCCGFRGLDLPSYEGLGFVSDARGLGPPYARLFGAPSYEVCPCCGFEFGNDDDPGTSAGVSFEDYRDEWARSGSPWFDASKRPDGWDLREQLERAGLGG